MKLKLYTDLSLISIGTPVDLLIPFIGISNEEYNEGRLYAHTFDEYCKFAHNYIEFTSIEECNACLLPIHYQPLANSDLLEKKELKKFLDEVKNSGKKIFIFWGHDIGISNIEISNAIIFSGAIDKSRQKSNYYSYPHFFSDLLHYNKTDFLAKPKDNTPIVGFCGYAPPLGVNFGREMVIGSLKLIANYLGIMKIFSNRVSHSYRARALMALKKSNKTKINFRIKQDFAFGPNGQLNSGSKESDADFRKNFINNILESDYTLCVRGIGNNSIRFFETLCCGRIPAFVNTDSVLPFDHIINWKKKCVWIEEADIDKIGNAISIFHNSISSEEFVELQNELRYLWNEYLSPLGFYKNLFLFL